MVLFTPLTQDFTALTLQAGGAAEGAALADGATWATLEAPVVTACAAGVAELDAAPDELEGDDGHPVAASARAGSQRKRFMPGTLAPVPARPPWGKAPH